MVLKTKSESGSAVAHLALGRFAIVRSAAAALTVPRSTARRQVIHDEVQHLVGADVAQPRGEQHGKDLVLANRVVQTRR